jgi:hypothetical protein
VKQGEYHLSEHCIWHDMPDSWLKNARMQRLSVHTQAFAGHQLWLWQELQTRSGHTCVPDKQLPKGLCAVGLVEQKRPKHSIHTFICAIQSCSTPKVHCRHVHYTAQCTTRVNQTSPPAATTTSCVVDWSRLATLMQLLSFIHPHHLALQTSHNAACP